eukprot:1158902-Pelagomonas_calceolata.AAC.6
MLSTPQDFLSATFQKCMGVPRSNSVQNRHLKDQFLMLLVLGHRCIPGIWPDQDQQLDLRSTQFFHQNVQQFSSTCLEGQVAATEKGLGLAFGHTYVMPLVLLHLRSHDGSQLNPIPHLSIQCFLFPSPQDTHGGEASPRPFNEDPQQKNKT